jgi:hypothetical protein
MGSRFLGPILPGVFLKVHLLFLLFQTIVDARHSGDGILCLVL